MSNFNSDLDLFVMHATLSGYDYTADTTGVVGQYAEILQEMRTRLGCDFDTMLKISTVGLILGAIFVNHIAVQDNVKDHWKQLFQYDFMFKDLWDPT